MNYTYNYLIEFSQYFSVSTCEEIIEQIDKTYGLNYDKVEKVYDREDRGYATYVHICATKEKLNIIREVLDNTGFKDMYDIYSRLVK